MKLKALLMLLLFSIFTGAAFNLAKYAVDYVSASSAASWRFGLAALTMLIVLLIKGQVNAQLLKLNGWMYIVLGIIGIFGFNALFFLGMTSTSPVNGALIMATNPLITTILSRLLLHTPITTRQGFGVGISLTGVILVITHGSWNTFSTFAFSTGDILILLGNLCWSLYGVLGKKYLRGSSSLQTTTYTMVVGALGLALFSAFDSDPLPVSDIPLGVWGAIAFMAFFTSVLGYLFWNEAIQIIGASQTSVFFNLVPVVTMIISVLAGAAITWVQLAGAGLVISGVVAASGFRFKRQIKRVPVKAQGA